MFVDASAIVALLSDEPEAGRIAAALGTAEIRMTSPIAVLEAALSLARPDKFNRPVAEIEPMLLDFLESRDIDIHGLPPPREATSLALSAAHRYRAGRHGLNLGDCLHYACAKFHHIPILATAGEFSQTDLETVASAADP